MTPDIRIALVADGVERDRVETALLTQPGLAVTGVVAPEPEAAQFLTEHPHDAVVIASDEDRDDLLKLIASAVYDRPTRPVVVAYAGSVNGFLRKALEAGADDLVTVPQPPVEQSADDLGRQISFALEKSIARRTGGTPAAGGGPAVKAVRGEMITVLGPKGGTGKTLTSCNLGAALAAAGRRVVVVDLDLQFGDVGLALGVPPERTIYDLATAGGSLDAEKVGDFLAVHPSGVRVLMAPRRPDHAGAVTVEFLRPLFDLLREMHDVVVVDTPPGFSPEVIAAIDRSSAVVIVAMLDALSLKNTKLAMETLELMDYDSSRISVVLNRADSRVGVTPEDVTQLLGRQPDIMVPSDRAITRSVNEATPVVLGKTSPDARRAFEELAAMYVPDVATKPSTPSGTSPGKRRRRWWFRHNEAKA